ncbi:MAG: hypothetical protein LUG92_00090 [Oscillospiraceae bacterium]|nr:hypothetical protein [Oscillospiraceae bacterium]
MAKTKHYDFEDATLEISLYYDAPTDRYFEEYHDFAARPAWTSEGCPFTHSVEDACVCGEWEERIQYRDCGSCRYFERIDPRSRIGVCRNEKRLWAGKTD